MSTSGHRARAVLAGLWCVSLFAAAGASPQGEAQQLEPGRSVERTLRFGEVHAYSVALERGDYLHLGLRTAGKNIQIAVEAFAPDGKKLISLRNNIDLDERDVGAFVMLAEASGPHRLELRSVDKPEMAGEYTITIKERRGAGERERKLVAACHRFSEAQRLHTVVGTGEALREAERLYREAAALFEQTGHRGRQGDVLMLLSDVYASFSEYGRSLQAAREALAIARAGGDTKSLVNTLMYVGEAHFNLNDYRLAIEQYRQALPLWQSLGPKYSWGVGWALHDTGSAYRALGEKEAAVGYFRQALEIYQAVDYSTRERARSSANVASVLGSTYSALGEKQRAIDALTLALTSAQEIHDVWVEGWVHQDFGDLYASLGEQEQAQTHYQESLSLWRTSGDPAAIAVGLTSLGRLYLTIQNLPAALDHLSQALEIGVKHNIRRRQAEVLTLLGTARREAGDVQQALDEYRRALPLWREINDRGGEATVLLEMGETFYRFGDYAQALERLEEALPLRHAVADREGEAATLYHLARVEGVLGRVDAAREHVRSALDLVESVRTSVRSLDLRASYAATVQDYFALYIDLLMRAAEREPQAGHAAEALAVSERARARSMLDTLSEAGVDLREGVESSLLARERRARQLLNDKSAYQVRLLSGKPTAEQRAQAASEVRAALDEFHAVAAEVRSRSPRYAALTQPAPLTLDAIQHDLLDADTMLLEYALGEERSYLWAVTRDSLASFTLAPRKEIEAAARRAYELLTARNRLATIQPSRRAAFIRQADAEYRQAAHALGRLVLPVQLELNQPRLLVVAQGALQFIPFGALPLPMTGGHGDGATRGQLSARRISASPYLRVAYSPLIAAHEVVSLPSASTLAALRREVGGRQAAEKAVAILADPVFSADDLRMPVKSGRAAAVPAGPAERGWGEDLQKAVADVSAEAGEAAAYRFERLPDTRWEADRIAAYARAKSGADSVLLAHDFAASRALALSPELGRYRVVHFASHAIINHRHPELSGVVLSLVNERGEAQDGFLRAHEIFNLKLPADLVMLSACRTGIGREVRGEGLMSLTRGLMYAGAARVGVSLWAVDDREAANLMNEFYRRFFGPRPVSAARGLAEAQRAMWHRGKPPALWAAFVLQGEWK